MLDSVWPRRSCVYMVKRWMGERQAAALTSPFKMYYCIVSKRPVRIIHWHRFWHPARPSLSGSSYQCTICTYIRIAQHPKKTVIVHIRGWYYWFPQTIPSVFLSHGAEAFPYHYAISTSFPEPLDTRFEEQGNISMQHRIRMNQMTWLFKFILVVWSLGICLS